MAAHTTLIIQGTAWGVNETKNGRRYLRVSVKPGYRDRNGDWVEQPVQNYSVWPAGYANLDRAFDQINQIRQDPNSYVDVTVVGEVGSFSGFQTKNGEIGASCNMNASAVAITNIRTGDGGQTHSAPPQPRQAGYAPQPRPQRPAAAPSDQWANNSSYDPEDPAF